MSMYDRRTVLAMIAAGPAAEIAFATAPRGQLDWAEFLSRHDLVWDRLPMSWDEGPFLGNGMMGAMFYFDAGAGAMRLDIGRSDVQDHRRPFKNANFDDARLPIGHFLLRTTGKLSGQIAMRLIIRDATMTAELTTSHGRIRLRAFVHAGDMALIVEAEATEGERDFLWEWVGEEALSPRQRYAVLNGEPARMLPGYIGNPPGEREVDGTEQLWSQPLLAGGGTVTAWRLEPSRLILSVAHAFPGSGARAEALSVVRRVALDRSLERRHLDWWHSYYPASFVSFSDTRIESFYWIQLYKLASATRADRALIDNQGPWLQPTPWPSAWWNLNVQLTYWLTLASNQAHLSGSLVRALRDNQDALIGNVDPIYRSDSATIGRTSGADLVSPSTPPKPVGLDGFANTGRPTAAPELGNLPWALHNVWLVWRHTMDDDILREVLLPILRRTTNYYRHFLKTGADGKLHLVPTSSPEYGVAADANYDLALLRWSCTVLIDAVARLGILDQLLPEWRRILDDLVGYPQDSTGFMIGADLPLTSSHRHYSHLLMVYPLYLVNRDQPGAAELAGRSVAHWRSMPEALRGYSSTGASSIASAFGRGDEALRYLNEFLDEYLRPNTLYRESGPVIETPLSGAQAVLDMLLQSWGGVIRPFPAVPSSWPQAVFEDLSAEGGFLVGAEWAHGATQWFRVQSRAGEPFVFFTDIEHPVVRVGGRRRAAIRNRLGHWSCELARGETALISRTGYEPERYVIPAARGGTNSFGINGRSRLKKQRDTRLPA